MVAAAKPALALLGVRAGLPVVIWVVWRVAPPTSADGAKTMRMLADGVEGLAAFAALICFFGWFARA